LLDALELGRGDAPREPVELDPKLLGRSAAEAWSARGRRRLRTSSSRSRARSAWIWTRASFSSAAMAAALELAEAGRLLDQRTALGRLRGEDLLDAALPDDGVHLAAEADVGQHLDDVRAAHVRAVDEVLALSAAMQAPGDRELRELERPVARLVVEEELDLREGGGLAAVTARVEDVVRLLRPELARAQAAAAQTIASETFDLPEPFGPTTTARPARGAPRPGPETT
jgi:hypothetical protein